MYKNANILISILVIGFGLAALHNIFNDTYTLGDYAILIVGALVLFFIGISSFFVDKNESKKS